MRPGPAWLLQQLPALVREGVLDEAAAERLRSRYAASASAGPAWSRIVFATLGAVLVGLGLILLAAHNWDQWSRLTRLLVSFAPLAVTQLALVWVLRRDADGIWREAVAASSALAFALGLAMVGQVFHFPGDLDRYLATCAALTLPLVYLLGSSLAAALYGAAVLGSVIAAPGAGGHPLLVVAAYALLLPHLQGLRRRDPESAGLMLLVGVLVPLLFAAVLASLPNVPRLGLWWLAGLGALLVLLDARQLPNAAPLWRRPLSVYGSLGVAIAALIASFADIWRGWYWYLTPPQLPEAWLLLSVLLGAVLWLAVAAWRQGRIVAALHALPALAMALVAAFDTRAWALPLAWLLSGFVLLLGLAMLREGLRDRHWGGASRGLFLITVLVLLRFLDTDWSFTVRGLVFVSTGIAFIVASLWLRRRMGS